MSALVVVGACYLDHILSVPRYPEEDEKLRAKSLSIRRGGNGPNTLEVLQQMVGGTTGRSASLFLCSTLPSSDCSATAKIRNSLGPMVDLSTCIYREDHTEPASSYIFSAASSGSRTIVNYNSLPEMTVDEFKDVCRRIESDEVWYHFEVSCVLLRPTDTEN